MEDQLIYWLGKCNLEELKELGSALAS